MTSLVFSAPPVVTAPVEGDDRRFPVRRIFCVGRNYQAHRREMGSDDREPPFFFTKPADALVPSGAVIPFPRATDNLHHEVELVIALAKGGEDIEAADALGHVFGYAVGVDLTRRDLQAYAKDRGQPWDSAKGFDHSAPMGAIRPVTGAAPDGFIRLSVNGQTRQSAALGDMIWSVPEIIVHASRLWRLAPGDLIFTGTPEGVSKLAPGDRIDCEIEGLPPLAFSLGGAS